MALEYYDDAIIAKLKKWTPTDIQLRILKPDETKRLFEVLADDKKDRNVKLPLIAISRNNDIELLLSYKSPKSYDGIKLEHQFDTINFTCTELGIDTGVRIDYYFEKSGTQWFLTKIVDASN